MAYDFPLWSLTVVIFWAGFVFSVYFEVIRAFIDNLGRNVPAFGANPESERMSPT